MIVAGFGVFCLQTRDAWRTVYAHLFGASTLYMLISLALNVASDSGKYYTGSLYDVPLICSFLWFGFAGAVAYELRDKLEVSAEEYYSAEPESEATEGGTWPARLAMAAVIS